MNQPTPSNSCPEPRSIDTGSRRSRSASVMAFCFLFFLWIVFSGRFDAFHLALGVLSCALVAAVSGDLLFTVQTPGGMIRLAYRFLKYIPWLLVQIFLANLHVLRLVFHPKMLELIDPHIIHFDSRLKSDASRTVLANSITLTPGTITVCVSAIGGFSVHCIDKKSGDALPGEMERRVAEVFDE